MPLNRAILEQQLADARQQRDACARNFQQEGIDESALKQQPAWRNLDAVCRQLTRRLNAVGRKDKLNEQSAARKSADSDDE
jgi:hypothetical protein